MRRYATVALRSLGYRVLVATTGPDALDLVRTDEMIALLFTDVIMPGGMNGRELADAVVAVRPSIGVLFTSGYTENAIVHHGRLDPGVRLLGKPYRRVDLARAVRAAIEAEPRVPPAS